MGLTRTLAGLFVVAAVVVAGVELSRREAPPPNVILVTIESLRTDHLPAYGGVRATSPHLDAFARGAVVYDDAHTVSSWTLPAHASLFTGLYPSAHGVVKALSRLDDSFVTLAEILAGRGYQCAGVVSGPYLRKPHNLHQGFEYYDESPSAPGPSAARVDVTNPRMDAALQLFLEKKRDPRRPLFLFAYFWDPHYDYIPPAPYDEMFVGSDAERFDVRAFVNEPRFDARTPKARLDYVISQYDGEIRWTDESLGRLFRLLESSGLWENTAVIVTADHGEEFFDHGEKGHRKNLYAETIHVPLMIRFPDARRKGGDPRLVSLVDLFATIVDLAGAESPELVRHGRSLRDPPDPDRAIFAELVNDLFGMDRATGKTRLLKSEHWSAIRRGAEKLLFVPELRRVELYDVEKDPVERTNLADGDWERREALLFELTDWQRRLAEQAKRQESKATLDENERERLRALGYLQ